MNLGTIKDVFLTAIRSFGEDKVPRLAAAQAYYTIFALAPLLLITIAIAGMIFGQDAARGELTSQLRLVLGPTGADAIEELLIAANRPGAGPIAAVIGFAALLFGATGFFSQLQDALNTIWNVTPRPDRGIWNIVYSRFLSFLMVLGVGALLLTSLVISTTLNAVSSFVADSGYDLPIVWNILNLVLSVALLSVIFALVFKVLPDVEIGWRDVWFGALVTTLLFLLGSWLLSIYLARSAATSAFGAAGSLVVILLWVNYTAQIVFFGAELTQVIARRFGNRIRPSNHAIDLTPQMRAAQGIPSRDYLDQQVKE